MIDELIESSQIKMELDKQTYKSMLREMRALRKRKDAVDNGENLEFHEFDQARLMIFEALAPCREDREKILS